jgi:hypothetical protein
MTGSRHTKLRRTGLALIAAFVAVAFTGSALGQDRPESRYYTPQQLEAMSANWAAKGRLLGGPDAASFYTRDQLQAMSSNWAAKGRLLGNVDAAGGATRARLLGTSPNVTSNGFDWSDFGLGAGAMLGLVLLTGGLAAGAYFGRKSGFRARPAS